MAKQPGTGLMMSTAVLTMTRGDQPPVFARVSQNVTVVAILLRTMSEPFTAEGRQVRNELRGLLECATVQQAKSSVSR
jgi:hypothetical protein